LSDESDRNVDDVEHDDGHDGHDDELARHREYDHFT
jgi:hypothetical protein